MMTPYWPSGNASGCPAVVAAGIVLAIVVYCGCRTSSPRSPLELNLSLQREQDVMAAFPCLTLNKSSSLSSDDRFPVCDARLASIQEALTEIKDRTDPKLHYTRGHSEPDMQNPWGCLKRIQRSTIIGDWRTLRH